MARVPRHYRDKLVSSQTGPNTLDTSGAETARAIGNMAETFRKLASDEVREQKASRESAERTKALSAYTNEYLRANSDTRKNTQQKPDTFNDAFDPQLETLKEQHLSRIENGRERSIMANEINSFNDQQSVLNTKWQIEQSSVVAQQTHKDRVDQDADFIISDNSADSFENYLTKIQKLEDDRLSFIKDFGVAKGPENIDIGKDAMSNALVTGMLSRGRVFEAAQIMKKPEFAKNVSEETYKKLDEKVMSAVKGESEGAAFRTAVSAASRSLSHSNDVIEGTSNVIALEEDINAVSFKIAELRKSPDPLSEQEASFLEKQSTELETLEAMRQSALEQVDARAVDDIATKGELKNSYQKLLGNESETKSVDELLNFRRDLEEARKQGKVSPKTYKDWMIAVETVYNRDVLDKISSSEKGVVFSGTITNKAMKKRLNNVFDTLDYVRGGEDLALATMEFYLDEVSNRTVEGVKLPDEVHDEILKASKAKAQLKTMGFPVYLTAGDAMDINFQSYNISRFDHDGMPVLEVKEK